MYLFNQRDWPKVILPCSIAWYSSPERRSSYGVGGVPGIGAGSRGPGRTFASLRHLSWGCQVRSSKLWACTCSTREIGQTGFCLAPDLGTPAQSSGPPSGLAAFLASVRLLGVLGVPLQASGTRLGGSRPVFHQGPFHEIPVQWIFFLNHFFSGFWAWG